MCFLSSGYSRCEETLELSALRSCSQWGGLSKDVFCWPLHLVVGSARTWITSFGEDPSIHTLVLQRTVTSCSHCRWTWGLGDRWTFLSETRMAHYLRLLQTVVSVMVAVVKGNAPPLPGWSTAIDTGSTKVTAKFVHKDSFLHSHSRNICFLRGKLAVNH